MTCASIECMPQQSLSFCKPETIHVVMVDNRREAFSHDVCCTFGREDITWRKGLVEHLFYCEVGSNICVIHLRIVEKGLSKVNAWCIVCFDMDRYRLSKL